MPGRDSRARPMLAEAVARDLAEESLRLGGERRFAAGALGYEREAVILRRLRAAKASKDEWPGCSIRAVALRGPHARTPQG